MRIIRQEYLERAANEKIRLTRTVGRAACHFLTKSVNMEAFHFHRTCDGRDLTSCFVLFSSCFEAFGFVGYKYVRRDFR